MRGHVRRWYIDLGDCFGSEWTVDGFSRRHGFAYLLDWQYLAEDFVTLGSIERPWERHERDAAAPLFGYFGAADFVVDGWRGEYPNPAFENLDEGDGAWATRIIARFTKEQIEAAVDVGDWTNPRHRDHLVEVLLARQKAILGRYFARLSPVTDVTADGDRICATDLARKTATWPEGAFHYRGSVKRGAKDRFEPLAVTALEGGRVCVPLASEAPRGGPPDDAAERYVVVRITNGIAPGPLELHFYDLGPDRGLGLVGIARPES